MEMFVFVVGTCLFIVFSSFSKYVLVKKTKNVFLPRTD